jgi:hypothetical protein
MSSLLLLCHFDFDVQKERKSMRTPPGKSHVQKCSLAPLCVYFFCRGGSSCDRGDSDDCYNDNDIGDCHDGSAALTCKTPTFTSQLQDSHLGTPGTASRTSPSSAEIGAARGRRARQLVYATDLAQARRGCGAAPV